MSFQSFILTSNAIIAVVNNKQYHVGSDHVNYTKLKEAYKNGDSEEFVKLIDVVTTINEKLADVQTKDGSQMIGVQIVNGEVVFNGKPMANPVVHCIKRMLTEGFNIDPMVKFLENLLQNPSYNSIEQLYTFLEKCGLSITEDGHFLAYKTVNSNYLDKYAGTYDNSPGAENVMPRNKVDDNPRNACSSGFHVGTLGYAGPGGYYNSSDDKVVICKINPRDVVSVPNDHDCAKLRVCRYVVVGDFQGELKSAVYSGKVGDSYSSESNVRAGDGLPERGAEVNDSDEMLIDAMYEFADKSLASEVGERRYGILLDTHYDMKLFDMIYPDVDEGITRMFKSQDIVAIREYDGETTDQDWLELRQDQQEMCDECGENCEECCCDEDEDEDEDEDQDVSCYW